MVSGSFSILRLGPFEWHRSKWEVPNGACTPTLGGLCHLANLRPADDASFILSALPRRKAVDLRQPVEAFAEALGEIVDPALAAQAPSLADLLHGHAQYQDLMHQHRTVSAEFALGAVEPQHRLALAFSDRLARARGIDIFARRIDRLGPAFGFLPIVLERPPALKLRLVDLTMAVQPPQRIVADRAQGDNFFSGLERQGIVDFDRDHFGVTRQILRPAVMNFCDFLRPVAFGPWHGGRLPWKAWMVELGRSFVVIVRCSARWLSQPVRLAT